MSSTNIMFKSKFTEVLKTFSKADYVKFGQFINSDYFNTSIMTRKLYNIFLKYAPGLSDEKLTKENLFQELYPGKRYREAAMLTLLSRIYKLSESYIAQETYNVEPFSQERYLLKGMNRRNLDKFVYKCYDDTLTEMNNSSIRDLGYFNRRQELEDEYISFLGKEGKGHNLDTEMIQTYYNSLLEFFIMKLLSVYAPMLNYTLSDDNINFDIPFLEYLIKYLRENSFDGQPAIAMYFNSVMLLKENDEKYLFRLKELLAAYPDITKTNEKRNLYFYLINFCIFKDNISGENKFEREAFELFKTIVKKNIYISEGNINIDHITYLSIVTAGLKVKEFVWVESFIIKKKDELLVKYRNNTYNLCYALFYFSQKNYEKSMECLNKVHREHIFSDIHINSHILQNYYELNLFENGFSYIDSHKHYLKENSEINSLNKYRTKNFLDVVNRLLKIKCGEDKYEASKFDLSEKLFKNILKKSWILEKIEEIQKS